MLTWGVFAMILGIAFEFMAVATALPIAAKELGGLSLFPWALTGFLGAVMFANGVAGEVCDRVGPRLPLIVGSITFTAGLLVSGLGGLDADADRRTRRPGARCGFHDRRGLRGDRAVLPRGHPAADDVDDRHGMGGAVGRSDRSSPAV